MMLDGSLYKHIYVMTNFKAISHWTAFDILMRPVREDQRHRRRNSRDSNYSFEFCPLHALTHRNRKVKSSLYPPSCEKSLYPHFQTSSDESEKFNTAVIYPNFGVLLQDNKTLFQKRNTQY